VRTLGTALLLTACATPAIDPPLRPRPMHVPATPCDGHELAMRAVGLVTSPTGVALADVPISRFDPEAGAWVELARTRPDGTWQAELDGPAWVGVAPWRAAPESQCVAIPRGATIPPAPPGAKVVMVLGGNDFFAPPLCDWRLVLPGAAGPAKVVMFRPDDRFELDTVARDGRLAVTAPCDVFAVAAFAEGVASAPVPGCAAPSGAACVAPGGGDVVLHARSAQRLRVADPGVDRAELTDGLRRATVGAGVDWWIPADARLRVDAPPRAPAFLELATARSLHGRLEGATWTVEAPLARAVVVACTAGGTPVPCPPRIACGASGGDALPCAPQGDEAACACPSGAAVAVVGTLTTEVPADATSARIELGPAPGGIVAKAEPSCHALAVRDLGWGDVLGGAPAISTRSATCDDAGTLTLPALPAGRWRVEVGGRAPIVADVGEATVDLGTLAP
jgi:hypothetical protein